ncbi:MAG: DUF2252 domain-containing protein [Deltaproteobacteria bacterium]|nr:MAG: DUF2252 domain-containing protein [Deltaproteobacteria bacterium]
MARDAVAEIIAYNRPGEGPAEATAEALRRKLSALANTPFQFLRGTFHLMACDLLQSRVSLARGTAPVGLIVGDLHLENFGVYRGQSGALVFDVNDFDDVGFGPVDLDLKRLCTSALLLPGIEARVRLEAAVAIAQAWASELEKVGGRFPIPPWTQDKAEGEVAELLRERGRRTQEELIEKVAPAGDRIADSEKFARVDPQWSERAREAFADYLEHLKQLKAPDPPRGDVLDVAYRFKGTGSLGRLRFTLLVGQRGERRLVEMKEARQSAMDQALGKGPEGERARVQTAAIRRLQGDPWPRVAATRLGGIQTLARENEPEEEKIGRELLAKDDGQLLSYARQCGRVLARLHARVNAPVLLGAAWDRAETAHAAVEFAERYAVQVEADQKKFVAAKEQVSRALAIS